MSGPQRDAFWGALFGSFAGGMAPSVLRSLRVVGFYLGMICTVVVVLLPGWARLLCLVAVLALVAAAMRSRSTRRRW